MAIPLDTETRLLRSLTEMIERATVDTALAVANYDPELKGWGTLLARLAVSEIQEAILSGQLNLYQANVEDIELTIAQAVARAHGKLGKSRLRDFKGNYDE